MDPALLVDELVQRFGPKRESLLRILWGVQRAFGYIPREALEALSAKLSIPLSELIGVASFFHAFKLSKPAPINIVLCMGTACHVRGNSENLRLLKAMNLESRGIGIETARCFGCCSRAPVIAIVEGSGRILKLFGGVTPSKLRLVVSEATKLAGGSRG